MPRWKKPANEGEIDQDEIGLSTRVDVVLSWCMFGVVFGVFFGVNRSPQFGTAQGNEGGEN